MKTLLVGDLHLKAHLILPIVEEKMTEYACQQVIFMGDYTDDWNCNRDPQLYLAELDELIIWKSRMEKHGKKVVTLLGNHDAPYLIDQPRGYTLVGNIQPVAEKLFTLGMQVAYELDDFLLSHAGFCWGQDLENWHLRLLTPEDIVEISDLEHHVGNARGGRYWVGSPIWADFRELLAEPNPKYLKQIVGHTPQSYIELETEAPFQIIGIDTFNLGTKGTYPYYSFQGNGDLLLYDDGKLEVIPTLWKEKTTLEAVYQKRGY